MIYYFLEDPSRWDIDTTGKSKIGEYHLAISLDNNYIVWPADLNKESITPEEIERLKEKFNSERWLFVDSLVGEEDLKCIINHVNRSGENFLRKQTPYKNGVMFLDVSNIYQEVKGLEKIRVSTIGKDRFNSVKIDAGEIWSLGVGLVAPVFHYLGVKISAVGANPSKYNWEKLLNITLD